MNKINAPTLLRQLLLTFLLTIGSLNAYAAEVVDINRADAATMIENWKGIGEVKARAIVAYRKKNGPFASINDLANVKGIGETLIKKNRKLMSVKGGIAKAKKPASTSKSAKKSTSKPASKSTKTKKDTTKKSTGKKKDSTKKSSSSKSTKKKPVKKKKPTKKKSTSKKSTT